jgi:hypothetical protein
MLRLYSGGTLVGWFWCNGDIFKEKCLLLVERFVSEMCQIYVLEIFLSDTRLKAVLNVGIYKFKSFTFCTYMRCSL